MKYFIGFNGGKNDIIEISSQKLGEIKNNFDYLQMIESVEEKYDIFICNYFDLEKYLLNLSLEESIFKIDSVPSMFAIKREIVRLFNNFLSSARLFLDHTDKTLKQNDTALQEIYTIKRSFFYDSLLAYRLLEYIRDLLQHKSIPFGYDLNVESITEDKGKMLKSTVEFYLMKNMVLENDKKIKQIIINDLEKLDEMIPLMKYIRIYTNCISDLRNLLIEQTESKKNQYIHDMYLLFDKFDYFNVPKEERIENFFYIYESLAPDKFKETRKIHDACFQNIEFLRTKNKTYSNRDKIIISNESRT
jgi:hypothetical protein